MPDQRACRAVQQLNAIASNHRNRLQSLEVRASPGGRRGGTDLTLQLVSGCPRYDARARRAACKLKRCFAFRVTGEGHPIGQKASIDTRNGIIPGPRGAQLNPGAQGGP